jgi:lipoprotein signal peptidase
VALAMQLIVFRVDFVIDFIYIKVIDFPVFNFADLCISSGTICHSFFDALPLQGTGFGVFKL